VQICFDAGFPETWQSLADQGARLVLWPSAYNGGFPLEAYAYIHHFFVVSSVKSDSSRIIDPLGHVRKTTDERLNVIYEDLSLDFAVCHSDFNYSILERISAAYGDKVALRSHRDSAHFLLECMHESVSITKLMGEFNFEPTGLYHERHRKAYMELRNGRIPEPQTAAHGNRAQYAKE
jgi:hypothetical protein